MILASLICFVVFTSASIDAAVNSAIEALVRARTTAVHEIEYHSVPRELARLATGASVRIVDEPRPFYRGRVSLPVEVLTSSGARDRYYVGICVRTFESVAVTAKMIDRHQELHAAQIIMQQCETTQLNGEPLTAQSAVEGMRSKQIIGAGKVVTAMMIEPLPVVVSGAVVTVCVKKENVTVKMNGTVRSDGWTGSVVAVEIGAQKHHVRARVVDQKNVEVVEQ
jgi:flagella basal body P-ring formation protein FlgA